MFSSFWLQTLVRRLSSCARTRKPPASRRPHRVRLAVEGLEDRVTPSVTVTTTLDPSTPIAGQLSLREAINMVNAGQVADNTIILPTGAYLNTQGALNVTHSLILQGAGANSTIIDGGGTDRVVLIDPAAAVNVQISGVTIRDGNTTGNGGGIEVQDVQGQSSVLTVTSCIISGNLAGSPNNANTFGGGIYVNNGDVNVVNSQVTANQAVAMDGGGFGGGVADGNQGTGNVTVTDSLVADNTAGAEGGGIALMNAGMGALTITGSTISDNALTAANAGGGGVFASSMGNVDISNTTIQGNTSLFDGGGFDEGFSGQAKILFNNDTITDNQSTQGGGGGIAVASLASVTIQNSTISGNSAAQSGGGIDFISGNAALTLTNSVVDSNRAGTNGGGINYTVGVNTVTLTDSTVSNNTATDLGGGLLVQSQLLTLQSSTVSGNTAGTAGGGIEDQALTLTATNSTIGNNLVLNGDGGGIDDATNGITQTLMLTDDTLMGNGAGGNVLNGVGFGGGLYDSNTTSTVTVVSCLFANNTSSSRGAGIEQAEGTLTIQTSQFTGNTAANNGGAIDFNAAAPLTISESTFNNNVSGFFGGALEFNAGAGASSLTNDTFVSNQSLSDGGAIDIENGQLALVNDTINGNTAGGNGGGVSDESLGTHSFQNTIVAGNTAAAFAVGGQGPDVFVGSGLSVTDNGGNFIGNLSGSSGFAAGTLTGNPLLGLLADNGGILAGASGDQQIVQTEALLPGSPAIGKGVANGAPNTDERGFPLATPPDIGAFQFQNVPLTVTVTPATPNLTLNGTETFTITVTNIGGIALPADNSTLTIILSSGLTTTGPLTFTLTALPAGQSQTFTVTATATTLGTQMLTATVTSPDTNPNSVGGNATVNVVTSSSTTNPVATHSPVGSLTLFAFGFGPTGIDLFEVDSAGDIFAVPFMGGGAPLFLNTTLHLPIVVLADGRLLALLTGSNGQDYVIDIVNPFDTFIEPAVLAALTHG